MASCRLPENATAFICESCGKVSRVRSHSRRNEKVGGKGYLFDPSEYVRPADAAGDGAFSVALIAYVSFVLGSWLKMGFLGLLIGLAWGVPLTVAVTLAYGARGGGCYALPRLEVQTQRYKG